MIQFNIFPGGKRRVATFSYDDGHNDAPLIALFNQYGIKGTFHLNGSKYADMTDAELYAVRKQYAGHEIACHTLQHGFPNYMPIQSIVKETMEDRLLLEQIAEYPVLGMSYPFGQCAGFVTEAMRSCGIVYARTTCSTGGFDLPWNFMHWNPSCHHKDCLALTKQFVSEIEHAWKSPLLYIWGHSHEFQTPSDWNFMEKTIKLLSDYQEKIWFAANIEIYEYITAQRLLRISADEHRFYNPTSTDVLVERDRKEIICIPAGKQIEA